MIVKTNFVSHNGKVAIIFIALGIVVLQHGSTIIFVIKQFLVSVANAFFFINYIYYNYNLCLFLIFTFPKVGSVKKKNRSKTNKSSLSIFNELAQFWATVSHK